MKQDRTQQELYALKRFLPVILLSMLFFSLSARMFFHFNGVGPQYKISQNRNMHGVVTRADGTSQPFEGNTFNAVHEGDTLTIYIDKPSKHPYGIGASLCFFVSNSLTDAYCGDNLLYAQDRSSYEQGIMPYNSFHVISLPPDYFEQTIRLDIRPVDRASFTSLNVWLSPSGHAVKSILVEKEFSFFLLITLIVISGLLALLLVILSIARRSWNNTATLALFCFLIVMWNFGSQGYFYIISDTTIASQGEYIFLYAACIPLSIYLRQSTGDALSRRISLIFVIYFSVLFLVASVLSFSSAKAGYSTVLPFLHGGAVLMLGSCFFSAVRDIKKKRTIPQKIADTGFLICLFIGLLEFLRFYVVNYFGTSVPLLRSSFGPIAIAVLVLSMILSAGYSYTNDYFEKLEQDHLRILAYQDNLTGIPNRSACYVEIDSMERNHITEYSMLFLDLNYLKKANDGYGHEIGDRMLKLTAQSMKKAFEGKGFYGRWGGDEFIACIPGDPQKADEALAGFHQAVKELSEANPDLPFGISIAVGRADSTAEHPLAPIDAINLADDDMYVNKKQMKAER